VRAQRRPPRSERGGNAKRQKNQGSNIENAHRTPLNYGLPGTPKQDVLVLADTTDESCRDYQLRKGELLGPVISGYR